MIKLLFIVIFLSLSECMSQLYLQDGDLASPAMPHMFQLCSDTSVRFPLCDGSMTSIMSSFLPGDFSFSFKKDGGLLRTSGTGTYMSRTPYVSLSDSRDFVVYSGPNGICRMNRINFDFRLHYPLLASYWCHAVYDPLSLGRTLYLTLSPFKYKVPQGTSELFTILHPGTQNGPLPTSQCEYVQNYKSSYFLQDSTFFFLREGMVYVRTSIFDTGGTTSGCLHCRCILGQIDDSTCGECEGGFHYSDRPLFMITDTWMSGGHINVHVTVSTSSMSVSFWDGITGPLLGTFSTSVYSPSTLAIVADLRGYTYVHSSFWMIEMGEREYALSSVQSRAMDPEISSVLVPFWDMGWHLKAIMKACNNSQLEYNVYHCRSTTLTHSMPLPLASAASMRSIVKSNYFHTVVCEMYACTFPNGTVLLSATLRRTSRISSPPQPYLVYREEEAMTLVDDAVVHLSFPTELSLNYYMANNSCTFWGIAREMSCIWQDFTFDVVEMSCGMILVQDMGIYQKFDFSGADAEYLGNCSAMYVSDGTEFAVIRDQDYVGCMISYRIFSKDGDSLLCDFGHMSLADPLDRSTALHIYSSCTVSIFVQCYVEGATFFLYVSNALIPLSSSPDLCMNNFMSSDNINGETLCLSSGLDRLHYSIRSEVISFQLGTDLCLVLLPYNATSEIPSENFFPINIDFYIEGSAMINTCVLKYFKVVEYPDVLYSHDFELWSPYFHSVKNHSCYNTSAMVTTMINDVRVRPTVNYDCVTDIQYVDNSSGVLVMAGPRDFGLTLNVSQTMTLVMTQSSGLVSVMRDTGALSIDMLTVRNMKYVSDKSVSAFVTNLSSTCIFSSNPQYMSPFYWTVNSSQRCTLWGLTKTYFNISVFSNSSYRFVYETDLCFLDTCGIMGSFSVIVRTEYYGTTAPSLTVDTTRLLVYLIFVVFIIPILFGICVLYFFCKRARKAIKFLEKHEAIASHYARNQVVRWASSQDISSGSS